MNIEVYDLAEHPEYAYAVANIVFRASWDRGQSPEDMCLMDIIVGLEDQTPGALPMTFVVIANGETIATMKLQEREVEHYDVGPWLSSVCMLGKYQKTYRGAMALRAGFEHAASTARKGGAGHLHLYTASDDLIPMYAKVGWKKWEKREHRGKLVNVGIRSLAGSE